MVCMLFSYTCLSHHCVNCVDVYAWMKRVPFPAAPSWCRGGYYHRGICLKKVSVTRYTPSIIPNNCLIYQPRNVQWAKSDYDAVCTFFSGSSSGCTSVDYDRNGGRCLNSQATLAYENNNNPDVWVNSNTFTWSPVSSGRAPDCQVITNPPGTVVYACRNPGTYTTSVRQYNPPVLYSCSVT